VRLPSAPTVAIRIPLLVQNMTTPAWLVTCCISSLIDRDTTSAPLTSTPVEPTLNPKISERAPAYPPA
jgi:hypothetical protein